MARPPVDGVTKDVHVNIKINQEDNDQLVELVKATGTSRSAIIRKAIKIVFAKAKEARKITAEKTQAMIKEGKFDFNKISSMNSIFEEELERELNNMAYQEVRETVKKKKSSSENSEDK
jgi:predicted transcriptional regulator